MCTSFNIYAFSEIFENVCKIIKKQNLNYITEHVSDLEHVCIKSLKKIAWEIKVLLAIMENSFDYLEITLKNQTLCAVLSLSLFS